MRAADKMLTWYRWRDSCQKYHPTWKHMFWDNAAAEQLLEEKYPWFLDTWRMYPRVVHRGEAPLSHILSMKTYNNKGRCVGAARSTEHCSLSSNAT